MSHVSFVVFRVVSCQVSRVVCLVSPVSFLVCVVACVFVFVQFCYCVYAYVFVFVFVSCFC